MSQKFDVTLIDASRFGRCCTSAATALLEYQLDDYAEDLLQFMNEEDIVLAYKMGLDSIEIIDDFIRKHGNLCHFRKCPSLMYTNNNFGIKPLEKEYEFRLKHGFPSVLYSEQNNPFPFKLKLGLYNENGGGELNPYLFTKQMIENSENQSCLFENTKLVSFKECDAQLRLIPNLETLLPVKSLYLPPDLIFRL